MNSRGLAAALLLLLSGAAGGFSWRGALRRGNAASAGHSSQTCKFGRHGCSEAAGEVVKVRPPHGEFVVDPSHVLGDETVAELARNMSTFNLTSSFTLYLVVASELPPLPAPRDLARSLLRDWFATAGSEKHLLILLVASTGRMEVATGGRVRRRLKDSAVRRMARKVAIPLGGGQHDAAARMAVKLVSDALTFKNKGKFSSFRSMLMPLMIIGALGVMFMRNQARARAGPGGMHGMHGMQGMQGMHGVGGMGMPPGMDPRMLGGMGMGGMQGMDGIGAMRGMQGMGGADARLGMQGGFEMPSMPQRGLRQAPPGGGGSAADPRYDHADRYGAGLPPGMEQGGFFDALAVDRLGRPSLGGYGEQLSYGEHRPAQYRTAQDARDAEMEDCGDGRLIDELVDGLPDAPAAADGLEGMPPLERVGPGAAAAAPAGGTPRNAPGAGLGAHMRSRAAGRSPAQPE